MGLLTMAEEERVKALFMERRGLAVSEDHLVELLRVLGIAPIPALVGNVVAAHVNSAPADVDDDTEVLLEIKVFLRLVEAHKREHQRLRDESTSEARAREVKCVSDMAGSSNTTVRGVLRQFCLLDSTMFEEFESRYTFISNGHVTPRAAATLFDLLGSEPHPTYPRQRQLRIPTYLDRSLPIFQQTADFFEAARKAHPSSTLCLEDFADRLNAVCRDELEALGEGRLVGPTAIDHFFDFLHGETFKGAAFELFRAVGAVVVPALEDDGDEPDAAIAQAQRMHGKKPEADMLSRLQKREADAADYTLFVTPKLLRYCSLTDAGRPYHPEPGPGDPMKLVLPRVQRPPRKIGLTPAFYQKLRGMVVMRYRDQQLMQDFKTHHTPTQHSSSRQPLHERVLRVDDFEQALRDFYGTGRADGLLEASSSEDDDDARRAGASLRQQALDAEECSDDSERSNTYGRVALDNESELLEWFFPSADAAAVELFQSTGIPVVSLDFPSPQDKLATAHSPPQRKGSLNPAAHRASHAVPVGAAGVPFPAGCKEGGSLVGRPAMARQMKRLRAMLPDPGVVRMVEREYAEAGGVSIETYLLVTSRIKRRIEAKALDPQRFAGKTHSEPVEEKTPLMNALERVASSQRPLMALKRLISSNAESEAQQGLQARRIPPAHVQFPRRWAGAHESLAGLPLLSAETPPDAGLDADDLGDEYNESSGLLAALAACSPMVSVSVTQRADDDGSHDGCGGGEVDDAPGPWVLKSVSEQPRRRRRVHTRHAAAGKTWPHGRAGAAVRAGAAARKPVTATDLRAMHPPQGPQFREPHTNRILDTRLRSREGPRKGFAPPDGGWVEEPRDGSGRLLLRNRLVRAEHDVAQPCTRGVGAVFLPMPPPVAVGCAGGDAMDVASVRQHVYRSTGGNWLLTSDLPRAPLTARGPRQAPAEFTPVRPAGQGSSPAYSRQGRHQAHGDRPHSLTARSLDEQGSAPALVCGRYVAGGSPGRHWLDAVESSSESSEDSVAAAEARAARATHLRGRQVRSVAGRVRTLLGTLVEGNRARYREFFTLLQTSKVGVVVLAGAAASTVVRMRFAVRTLQRFMRCSIATMFLNRMKHMAEATYQENLRAEAIAVLSRWMEYLKARWEMKGRGLIILAEKRQAIYEARAARLMQRVGRAGMVRIDTRRKHTKFIEKKKRDRVAYLRQRQRDAQIQIATNVRRRKWQLWKEEKMREIYAMRDREAVSDRAAVMIQMFSRTRLSHARVEVKLQLRAFDRLELPPEYR